MFKKLSTWIATIFRRELEVLETLWAREFVRRDQQIAADFKALESSFDAKILDAEKRLSAIVENAASDVRRHAVDAHADTQSVLDEHVEAIKTHASTLHGDASAAVLDVRRFIAEEMAKVYADLVKDAAGAARLLEISKISQAVCDYCHIGKRRFSVSRVDGKIVCADCAANGQK